MEKSSETIEYDTYVANVQMASALMDLRKPDLVRQRLDACPERLRGWEWNWLNAKSDNSITILKGHTAAVSTVAFSPNGAQFVTASSDSTARVWDATTHRSIVLSGSPKDVMSASFSPDGKRVLTVSGDFVARVWDAVTGVNTVTLDRFPTPNSPGRMADHALFSPDGTRIVAGTYQGLIEVYQAGTGKFLMEWDGERGKIESMSFSPDGTRLATASDGSAGQVWDLTTGKLLVEFARHRGQPDKVMFSPDGKKVITAGAGGAVRVWNVATGACLHELGGHSKSVSAIAYSPDGHCIVTSSFSGEVWVWDAATGTRRFDLKGHTSLVKAISFNLDGKRFVTGSGDCTARLWDSTTGEALAEFVGHTGRVSSVAFAPDGRTVVTASSDGTARVWDAAAPSRVGWPRGWNNTGSLKPPDFPAPVTLGAFSPDGSRVVTGTSSGTIRVWDSTTRALLLELHGHSEQVDSAAFSPDGAWIVTNSFDNTARAWDATTGDCIMVMNGVARGESTSGYRPPVVVVSPDSIRLAIGSWDGTSALWNSHTWQPICPFESNVAEVRCTLPFAFSPDCKRVATVAGSITRVWDAAAGTHLFDLQGHQDAISCIAFTPDGQRIATADVKGQVSLWNAATGTRLLELGGNAGSVFAIAVDPTGTRMATMSNDGPAWMWDVHTGARVCTLQVNNEPLRRAVFTPDGKRLLSGSWSGKGRVWNVEWGRSMLEMANVFVSSQGPSDWQWSPDSMRILATHEESGRVFDAIPYRERFAYVEAFRSSTSRLKPRILQRIRSGERAFDLRREYCGLHELQISERHAAMAIICEEEQRVTGRAEVNPQSSQTLTSTAWQVVRSEQSASAAGPAGLAIALDQARQARTVFPERQENCVALGVCLFRLGRYEEAIAMLQTPEAT